ncbi:MAG TPA: response regulator [Candidatus Angelobacter sp.]|nr:response regulator [Candidatus Angelobacter sp.]
MHELKSHTKALAVLLLEDNVLDAELAIRKLKTAFEIHADTVRSASEFQARVLECQYDVILGDYRIPGWNGLEAVKWLRSRGITTPFILVTGTLGDELAIDCLKAGANDYVLKENLGRLPVAVRRSLSEQALRDSRDRAELELRTSEGQYRMLFQANPQPMWVFDCETLHFLAVNDAAVHHYGFTLKEFFSMTLADIRPVEERSRFFQDIQEQRQHGFHSSYNQPWTHRKKDGTIINVEVTAQPIKFRGLDAQLVMINDVTERKKLEEQFLHAQKMEAIGQLAGGVAHDFNNLLMIIGSYAHLTRDQLADAEKAGRYLSQIATAVGKATVLTRQLLAFSRKHTPELRAFELNELIADFCKMLPTLLGADVELRVQPSLEQCVIHCDRGLLEQVIMNLAVNARDAMPKGGRITIETERARLNGPQFQASDPQLKPGEYVMLAVTDTGIGMDEKTKSRIFEPFFTTKEPGKGTGLGLSTVYNIVSQCHGHMRVYSELGHGTTFKIYFPLVRGLGETTPEADESDYPGGTETILLVEDEQALRTAATEFLETKGYRVLPAADATQAFRLCESENEIDLLLTDVVMPGMRGVDLARILLDRHPATRVIFMSGFAGSALRDNVRPGSAFLQKPFGLQRLAHTIRQVLEKRRIETEAV